MAINVSVPHLNVLTIFPSVWGIMLTRCVQITTVSVVYRYNGGFFPDMILSSQLNAIKRFLYLQPMTLPQRFDIFSPLTGGCSEGLDAFSAEKRPRRSP